MRDEFLQIFLIFLKIVKVYLAEVFSIKVYTGKYVNLLLGKVRSNQLHNKVFATTLLRGFNTQSIKICGQKTS